MTNKNLPEVPVLPESTVATCNEGNTAIVVDDHCYAIRNWNGKNWVGRELTFREALDILKTLPDNPDDVLKKEVAA